MNNKFSGLFLFITILVCSSQLFAQTFTPVKDDADVRKKIADVALHTTSIKSDFAQEKNLSMISEKVKSKGTFYFKKENRIRLEYLQPFKYLMVINNGKIAITDEAKSTQMDMHKSKLFQQVNNMIINCVQGTVSANGDFKVEILENATQLKLVMTPTTKGLQEFFQNIYLFLDKKDYSAVRIEMNEKSGDNTIISFTNKVINGKIDDSLFAVK